jgi:pimeloyl-ACP methyl ester carboxylesterase
MHTPVGQTLLETHLYRVVCPTLVIWGRDDKLIPLNHGKYYAAHIPEARLEIFDRCGHMVPFETTDEFVEQTIRFIKQ